MTHTAETGMEPRHLEAAALAAVPALRTESCYGWQVRFAHGCSRRANSVAALDEDAGAPPTTATTRRATPAASAGLPVELHDTPPAAWRQTWAALSERQDQAIRVREWPASPARDPPS